MDVKRQILYGDKYCMGRRTWRLTSFSRSSTARIVQYLPPEIAWPRHARLGHITLVEVTSRKIGVTSRSENGVVTFRRCKGHVTPYPGHVARNPGHGSGAAHM
eukprot:2904519-Rhodomonas_salina.2